MRSEPAVYLQRNIKKGYKVNPRYTLKILLSSSAEGNFNCAHNGGLLLLLTVKSKMYEQR